jgi:hypothetical protein
MKAMLRNMRGQVGTAIIGLVIGVILIVAVLIPVTDDVVQNQSFTGTTKTITDLFVVLEAVAGLVLIAGSIFIATR